MKANPYVYAGIAIAYIGIVALFLRFIESIRHDTPDTILDGMRFLSLFTLSAVIMGFLFFSEPLVLFLEHKKSEAITFFLKTIGTFALITSVLLAFASMQ